MRARASIAGNGGGFSVPLETPQAIGTALASPSTFRDIFQAAPPACFAEVAFSIGTDEYQEGRICFGLDRAADDISLSLEIQGANVYPKKNETFANPEGNAVISVTPAQARLMATVLEGYAQALERDYDRLLQERNDRVAAIDARENDE